MPLSQVVVDILSIVGRHPRVRVQQTVAPLQRRLLDPRRLIGHDVGTVVLGAPPALLLDRVDVECGAAQLDVDHPPVAVLGALGRLLDLHFARKDALQVDVARVLREHVLGQVGGGCAVGGQGAALGHEGGLHGGLVARGLGGPRRHELPVEHVLLHGHASRAPRRRLAGGAVLGEGIAGTSRHGTGCLLGDGGGRVVLRLGLRARYGGSGLVDGRDQAGSVSPTPTPPPARCVAVVVDVDVVSADSLDCRTVPLRHDMPGPGVASGGWLWGCWPGAVGGAVLRRAGPWSCAAPSRSHAHRRVRRSSVGVVGDPRGRSGAAGNKATRHSWSSTKQAAQGRSCRTKRRQCRGLPSSSTVVRTAWMRNARCEAQQVGCADGRHCRG